MRELMTGGTIGAPVIVLYETICGFEKSDRREKSRAAFRAFLSLGVHPLTFEIEDAERAGQIRAEFGG